MVIHFDAETPTAAILSRPTQTPVLIASLFDGMTNCCKVRMITFFDLMEVPMQILLILRRRVVFVFEIEHGVDYLAWSRLPRLHVRYGRLAIHSVHRLEKKMWCWSIYFADWRDDDSLPLQLSFLVTLLIVDQCSIVVRHPFRNIFD